MQATIKITGKLGVCFHAQVKVGRKVVHETSAWGDAFCASRAARAWAASNGYTIKTVQ